MALNRRKPTNVPEKEGKESVWTNLAKGEYEGRLVYIADLGLQERTHKGTSKGNFQQISLGIEILGHGMEHPETGEWMPRILWSKPFFIYSEMDERSMEYKMFKIFDPDAEAGEVPDWEGVLGAPCNVKVVNLNGTGESKDRVYDNIDEITPIPAKYLDKVEEATVEEMGIGDADDAENFVTKQLRGLCKYVWEHRVHDDGTLPPEPKEEVEEEKPKAAKAAKGKTAKAATPAKGKKASPAVDNPF